MFNEKSLIIRKKSFVVNIIYFLKVIESVNVVPKESVLNVRIDIQATNLVTVFKELWPSENRMSFVAEIFPTDAFFSTTTAYILFGFFKPRWKKVKYCPIIFISKTYLFSNRPRVLGRAVEIFSGKVSRSWLPK